jgi:hypothetical protein
MDREKVDLPLSIFRRQLAQHGKNIDVTSVFLQCSYQSLPFFSPAGTLTESPVSPPFL